MRIRKFLCVLLVPLCGVVFAGDTNFVAAFNNEWRTENASNILAFADAQLSTNRRAETLFARGLVAIYLQEWGRGATNYLGQAIEEVSTNLSYSAAGRSNIVQRIKDAQGSFAAISADANEPVDSQPSWNTNTHAVIFNELGDEIPFLLTLEEIAEEE